MGKAIVMTLVILLVLDWFYHQLGFSKLDPVGLICLGVGAFFIYLMLRFALAVIHRLER